MSENEKQKQPDQNVVGNSAARNTPQSARRRLLKSTVAIPVIMTLHSGAALARTSNLVGPIEEGVEGAVKFANNTGEEQLVCVNGGDGALDGVGPTYDLGNFPTADLMPLENSEGPLNIEAQAALCRNDGGILISATAYTSLQGKGFLSNLPPL
jgi:hypothetical protein